MASRLHVLRWKVASDSGASRQRQTLAREPAHPAWPARLRRFFLRPTWKTLPLSALLVCIAAAIPAPPVAWFFGWLLDVRWEEFFRNPAMMILYAWFGAACQALGAYLLGILPLEYLRPRLRKYPTSVTYVATIGLGLVGASAGTMLAFSRARDVIGGAHVLRAQPPIGRLLALSLMFTLSAALIILLIQTGIAEAENRERALAEAAALAKAHALQSQINPHFFFNTLTTVSALAELDSRSARELVGQLAQLFRYTLSCSQFEMVTLAQELDFVANYLRIEQARFRRRLRFELPTAGEGAGLLLPGLTLQPIVENAVRHGIAKRREGGIIKVALERVSPQPNSMWVISVANQIAQEDSPLESDQIFRPGHALANTRDRLALAFHGQSSLEFLRDGPDWVKVVLKLPATPGPS
jgi:hypothetical protein